MKTNHDLQNEPGVYLIIDDENKRAYVGSTTDLRRRYNRHNRELRNHEHYNPELQKLYDEKKDQLTFVGMPVENKEEALDFEQAIIDELHDTGVLCNKATDARHSTINFVLSEEHKAKLIAGNLGRPKSEEQKQAISRSLTGRTLDPEHAAKARMAAVGFKHTEEFKRNLSEKLKGVPKSEEARRNQSLAAINPVEINGEVYRNVLEATRQLNIGRDAVNYRIKSPNFPDWKRLPKEPSDE